MNDSELIELIATLWVSNGGDAQGFDYCYSAIRKKIKEKEEDEK